MEGRCLFEDGDLHKPDLQVSKILQSSSLWDLILFKTMMDLKEKQGLINQLLSAIDIIHISLGSLLHDCLTPLEEEGELDKELEESNEHIVLQPDLARLLGFPEITKMKLRQKIPFKYSNLFKTMQLLEKSSFPSLNNSDFDEEGFDLFNQTEDLSSTVKVELEEYENDRLNNDLDDFDYPDEDEEDEDGENEDEGNITLTGGKRLRSASMKIVPQHEASQREKTNMDNSSSELSLECSKCHKVYSSKRNVRRHMKKCLSNKEEKLKVKFPDFVCVFCETSYSTFLGYKNHVNVTCSKKPEIPLGFLCDKCKIYVFKPPGSEHPCEPYFNCDKCNFKCYNENHFRQHYRLVHLNVGTIYCCEVCGKTFDSKTRLGYHLVVHTKERSFLCTECGKGFGRKSVLDVHMSVHFSKNVPCNICGKIFAHSNLVRKHIAAQHPKDGILTREPCPHCSSSFRSKFYLIKHIKHKHGLIEGTLTNN